MTGSSVSAVTAYTAHREWASRPPDERYATVHSLYEAASARRARIEECTVDSVALRTEAVASGASRLGERVNTGVPFVGWPLGPFPMRGVRGDSRYTSSVHGVLLSDALWANEGRKRSTAAMRARRRGQDGHNERGQTWRLMATPSSIRPPAFAPEHPEHCREPGTLVGGAQDRP